MPSEPRPWIALWVLLGCAPTPADDELQAPQSPLRASPSAALEQPADAQGPNRAPPASLSALPPAVTAWWPEITTAAADHGVPPELVALVVWLESSGDPDARSPMGALGLMQLMPATASKVASARGEPAPTEDDLLDPARNLDLGCAHLAELTADLATLPLDAAGVHRIAIAYNGGMKTLTAWEGGQPLPAETERYAATLRDRWQALAAAPAE